MDFPDIHGGSRWTLQRKMVLSIVIIAVSLLKFWIMK